MPTATELRNNAILALINAGLEPKDIAGMMLDDFNTETGELRIVGRYRVYKKPAWTTTLQGHALDAMRAYVRTRGNLPPADMFVRAIHGDLIRVFGNGRYFYEGLDRGGYTTINAVLHKARRNTHEPG
jgi:integrase